MKPYLSLSGAAAFDLDFVPTTGKYLVLSLNE